MNKSHVIWLLFALFSIYEIMTPLNYVNKLLMNGVNLFVIFSFVVIILIRKKKVPVFYSIVFTLHLGCFLTFTIVQTFRFGSEYKTQDIWFRQIDKPENRIEYVWSDIGAFGYNRTMHKVIQITPLFEWRVVTDTTNLDLKKWRRVDEYVNELELKGG